MDLNDLVTKSDINTLRADLIKELSQIEAKISPEKKWLRSKEVAKYLDISASCLHNFITQGLLQPKKLGGLLYFSKSDIDSLFLKE